MMWGPEEEGRTVKTRSFLIKKDEKIRTCAIVKGEYTLELYRETLEKSEKRESQTSPKKGSSTLIRSS